VTRRDLCISFFIFFVPSLLLPHVTPALVLCAAGNPYSLPNERACERVYLDPAPDAPRVFVERVAPVWRGNARLRQTHWGMRGV